MIPMPRKPTVPENASLAAAVIIREENCLEERENRGFAKRDEVGLCLKWRGICGQIAEPELNAIANEVELEVLKTVVLDMRDVWQLVLAIVIAVAIASNLWKDCF